jgi:hypothetical protein
MKQITTFWNWFQDNEEAIKNAFLLGINTEEVFTHLLRNYNYISKRIGFIIYAPQKNTEKCKIVFTAEGYRKLFPKIIALEDHAPKLRYFIPQAFIKPMQQVTKIKKGTDLACTYENYEFKMSDLQIALPDYNVTTKQLNIKLYIPNYDRVKHFEELQNDLKFLVMEVIGEIAFRKHIKLIEIDQLPQLFNGLLPLIELPDYIDYLYKINAKGTTRIISSF